ncbi:MAG: hypothetical protein OXH52_07265 [Gammaproteobacteria bacterium]|nr:hypothetical protein [Gammaproteobacteria bacterium]
MKRKIAASLAACVAGVVLVSHGCASTPSNASDICDVFDEKPGWYRHAKKAEKTWNIPIPIMMATAYKESSFRHDARPPRTKILGVIPWRRPSSALGFAQATDETWEDYKRDSGHARASRKRFSDAIDFVGWYHDRAHRALGIPRNDARSLYLAYHEGLTGYRNGAWKRNAWLRGAADRVAANSQRYTRQLRTCRRFLDRGWLGIFG